jgi:putative redox protein
MEKDPVIRYSNDEVTVLWKPRLCQHSAKCWKGLPSVFKPREKHWIIVDGADAQRIIDQVRQCPSGALSIEGD